MKDGIYFKKDGIYGDDTVTVCHFLITLVKLFFFQEFIFL
jgi:hypothetical protein